MCMAAVSMAIRGRLVSFPRGDYKRGYRTGSAAVAAVTE